MVSLPLRVCVHVIPQPSKGWDWESNRNPEGETHMKTLRKRESEREGKNEARKLCTTQRKIRLSAQL
ncbi:unnamed protein product [Allacma fusca]|uniref:Uncharacterized protein n=1 Tax=Allacma fusca TaxID=39272 RepID=A0A8J2K6R7_9HEXA|nr:unnamed protein product [Allacma fusca]